MSSPPPPKTVLITGANQGLGFHTAQILSSTHNYHVIITSRSLPKVNSAIESLTTQHNCPDASLSGVEMDVTSPTSIATALASISKTHPTIDVLINNAGIASRAEDVHEQFSTILATNVTGAAMVTATFLPLLTRSTDPRILHISSGLGSITMAADKDAGWAYYDLDATAYRCSKAALDMLALQQSKFLGKEGVKVWAVDPGWRATNLGGDAEAARARGASDPVLGAEVIVECVRGGRDGECGKLISEGGVVLPW